jgi:son of sevenless-like protein
MALLVDLVPKKPRKAKDLTGLLGDNIPTIHKDLAKPPPPSYLRPDYKEDEISMDLADGTVKAGTINALIEKLTAHDTTVGKICAVRLGSFAYKCPDSKMIDTFMMTWKSFVSTDSLVEGLIKRFRLPPPENLTEKELDQWRTQKLNIVRTRYARLYCL